MPWNEVSTMSLRREFVQLASQEGANVRQLCRRFEVSAKTAYKWLARFDADGPAGLADRSRRPRHSPSRTSEALEQAILKLRSEHPAWGGRKLRARLQTLGTSDAPSASTITAILRRGEVNCRSMGEGIVAFPFIFRNALMEGLHTLHGNYTLIHYNSDLTQQYKDGDFEMIKRFYEELSQ